MRKVIEYTLVSADGVFEDPVAMGVGEYQDEAYLRDGLGLLSVCDALLFGRAHRPGLRGALRLPQKDSQARMGRQAQRHPHVRLQLDS